MKKLLALLLAVAMVFTMVITAPTVLAETTLSLEYGDTCDFGAVSTSDEAVVTVTDGTIKAVGLGTATVQTDTEEYSITVSPATVDVVLFTGQSNMVSYATGKYDFTIPEGQGYVYKYNTDSLETIGGQVGEDHNNLQAGSYGQAQKFCEKYIEETGRKMVIVHAAKGGTAISDFQKGGSYYTDISTKYLAAISNLEANPNFTVGKRFYLFFQGETDAMYSSWRHNRYNNIEYYKENFLALHNDFKADLGLTEAFILYVGNIGTWTREAYNDCIAVNYAHNELAEDYDDITLVNKMPETYCFEPGTMNADHIHFNGPAQGVLAEETVKNYLQYLKDGKEPAYYLADKYLPQQEKGFLSYDGAAVQTSAPLYLDSDVIWGASFEAEGSATVANSTTGSAKIVVDATTDTVTLTDDSARDITFTVGAGVIASKHTYKIEALPIGLKYNLYIDGKIAARSSKIDDVQSVTLDNFFVSGTGFETFKAYDNQDNYVTFDTSTGTDKTYVHFDAVDGSFDATVDVPVRYSSTAAEKNVDFDLSAVSAPSFPNCDFAGWSTTGDAADVITSLNTEADVTKLYAVYNRIGHDSTGDTAIDDYLDENNLWTFPGYVGYNTETGKFGQNEQIILNGDTSVKAFVRNGEDAMTAGARYSQFLYEFFSNEDIMNAVSADKKQCSYMMSSAFSGTENYAKEHRSSASKKGVPLYADGWETMFYNYGYFSNSYATQTSLFSYEVLDLGKAYMLDKLDLITRTGFYKDAAAEIYVKVDTALDDTYYPGDGINKVFENVPVKEAISAADFAKNYADYGYIRVCNTTEEYMKDESSYSRVVASLGDKVGSALEIVCLSASTNTTTGVTTNYSYKNPSNGIGSINLYGYEPCDHIYTVETTDPTCTEDGAITSTCSICSHVKTEAIPALGHDLGEWTVTTAPTCLEAGEKQAVCNRCGETVTEAIDALGHDYVSEVTTPVTCTTDGVETFTCSHCGDSYTVVLPALGHNYNNGVTVKPATSTSTGLVRFTCQTCGDSYDVVTEAKKVYSGALTSADLTAFMKNHNLENFWGYVAYKNTEDGNTQIGGDNQIFVNAGNGIVSAGSTSADGAFNKSSMSSVASMVTPFAKQFFDPSDVFNATDTSYTTSMLNTYVNDESAENAIARRSEGTDTKANSSSFYLNYKESAGGNSYSGTISTTTSSNRNYFVLDMGERYDLSKITAIENNSANHGAVYVYARVTDDVNTTFCPSTGVNTLTGEQLHSAAPSAADFTSNYADYGFVRIGEDSQFGTKILNDYDCSELANGRYLELFYLRNASTFNTAGYHQLYNIWFYGSDVDVCQHSDKALTDTVAASCTSAGSETYTCNECGEAIVYHTPMLEHSYDEGVTENEATCTADGKIVYTCANCGGTKEVVIPALGHNYGEAVITIEPTCTEAGEQQYTCSVCGDVKTETVAALGHTWDEGKVVTEATCAQTGEIKYTCTVCGETRTEELPLLGHTYVLTETQTNNGYTCNVYKCSDCDKVIRTDFVPVGVDGDGNYSGGLGTAENPYLLSTPEDFNTLTNNFSKAGYGSGIYFKQTCDIDMTGFEGYEGTNAGSSNKLIFAGVYDGDGHKITVDIASSNTQVSIFPYVIGGTIKNLIFDGQMTALAAGTYMQPIRTIGTSGNKTSAYILNCSSRLTMTGNGTTNAVSQSIYATVENWISQITVHSNINAFSPTFSGTAKNVFYSISNPDGKAISKSSAATSFTDLEATLATMNTYSTENSLKVWSINDNGFATFSAPKICDIMGHYYVDGFCVDCGKREVIKGDVNGDRKVTLTDAVMLSRYIAEFDGVTIIDENSDTNGDGNITIEDATVLTKYLAGWEGFKTLS